jgi:hypothetical protein
VNRAIAALTAVVATAPPSRPGIEVAAEFGQYALRRCERRRGRGVEHDIEAFVAHREVLFGVVDHVVGAEPRTKSALRALHTPVTYVPRCFAIWTAKWPTPPAAPVTSTR